MKILTTPEPFSRSSKFICIFLNPVLPSVLETLYIKNNGRYSFPNAFQLYFLYKKSSGDAIRIKVPQLDRINNPSKIIKNFVWVNFYRRILH